MARLRRYILIFVAVWTLVILPADAMAQAWMNCNVGAGTVNAGKLWNTDTTPGGFCSATGQYHVFSHLVCNVVLIINDALGRIYCSLQYELADLLRLAITIYIASFGAQLLMGSTQLTVKEVMFRLLKAIGVWTFATYSGWGIGLAFNFFIDVMSSGVYWVLQAIPNAINHSRSAPYCYDAVASSAGGIMGIFAMLDESLCNAVYGPLSAQEAEVLGFFAVVSYNIPPIFGLIVSWLWMNLVIMVRALISFLLGISATAFLIAISPIFMSMMLFQATYPFFENWLKYLISFTLQVIIIFAVVAMWLLITLAFIDFFDEMAQIIIPYKKDQVYSSVQDPVEYWAICPYIFGNDSYGPWVQCAGGGGTPLPGNEVAVPAEAVIMHADLVYYICYHLITLMLIVYAFESLLKEAPKIAQQLAGPQYVPSIGMGFGVNKYGQVRSIQNPQALQAQNIGARTGGGGGMSKLTDGIGKAIADNIRSRIGRMAVRR